MLFSEHVFSKHHDVSRNRCFQHVDFLQMRFICSEEKSGSVVFKNPCKGDFFTPVCEHGTVE